MTQEEFLLMIGIMLDYVALFGTRYAGTVFG